jgi:ABC-type uncharacterized transport system auxiliary subunit
MNDVLNREVVRSYDVDMSFRGVGVPSSVLDMGHLVGLDQDLREFEVRLLGRHTELLAAAARLKDLIDTIRQARADPEGKP